MYGYRRRRGDVLSSNVFFVNLLTRVRQRMPKTLMMRLWDKIHLAYIINCEWAKSLKLSWRNRKVEMRRGNVSHEGSKWIYTPSPIYFVRNDLTINERQQTSRNTVPNGERIFSIIAVSSILFPCLG